MEYLDKVVTKEYKLSIIVPRTFLFIKYKRLVTIKYKQISAYELLKHAKDRQNKNFDLLSWYIDFVKEHSNCKKQDLIEIVKNFDKIIDNIEQTYFGKSFKSEQGQKILQDTDAMPFEAYIQVIAKELNLDPIKLLKTYTFDQINYFAEGVVWNSNNQTEEGRKKNKNLAVKKKYSDPEVVKNVKDLLDKIPD